MRQSLKIAEPIPQPEEEVVEKVKDEKENSSPSKHTSLEKPYSEEPLSEHPSSKNLTSEDP